MGWILITKARKGFETKCKGLQGATFGNGLIFNDFEEVFWDKCLSHKKIYKLTCTRKVYFFIAIKL